MILVHAPIFHLDECRGRAHFAHISSDAELCQAADFFGNNVQEICAASPPRVTFEQAKVFTEFIKRFRTPVN
jgi:hypothetical protein